MTGRAYDIDAPDQQRLKIARAEIEAVLQKHDLAGAVVLHTPGMAEWFYQITPSYSRVWLDEAIGALRIRSKAENYGGDVEAQRRDQVATANMVACLADQLILGGLMFREMQDVVDRTLRAQHTGGVEVPDPNEARRQ